MSEYQEFTGKSVEEAIKAACDAFSVGLGDLDFEILTPGSRGGEAGSGVDSAASRLGAAPPRALRGAATIRAGSAPIPSTPREPGVRISKSRSPRPTLNASQAALMASSTDLPVNSWYSLMVSVVSLVARSAFGWAGSSTWP